MWPTSRQDLSRFSYKGYSKEIGTTKIICYPSWARVQVSHPPAISRSRILPLQTDQREKERPKHVRVCIHVYTYPGCHRDVSTFARKRTARYPCETVTGKWRDVADWRNQPIMMVRMIRMCLRSFFFSLSSFLRKIGQLFIFYIITREIGFYRFRLWHIRG